MTSDLALYKFGLYLIVALAVMLALTHVFERRSFFYDTKVTDWLVAAFTFALAAFTWALVNVASKQTEILSHTDTALNSAATAQIASAQTGRQLAQIASQQTEILSHTDQALHLAATAQSASAQTAEKLRLFTEATERAWIGTTGFASEPIKAGDPVKLTMSYNNTGRLPASFSLATQEQFLSVQQWNDGEAQTLVYSYEDSCINNLPQADVTKKGVVYPTTGPAFYTVKWNSMNPATPESRRFVVSQANVSNGDVFISISCFVYKDLIEEESAKAKTHHTFVCYFYNQLVTDEKNWNFCDFEHAQYAD
jgi:hypothetical protein